VACGCSQKNAENSDIESDELRYLRWSSFSPENVTEILRPEAGNHRIGKNMKNLKLFFRAFLFHFGIDNGNLCYWFKR
jgi:hypothetical protein